MARNIFSAGWYYKQGLNGAGDTITVPENHVYVVKQLTAYSTPLANSSAHFRDLLSGATLFSAFFTLDHSGWQGFYGAIVFGPGSSFRWEAQDNTPEGGVDVYVGGYDLIDE